MSFFRTTNYSWFKLLSLVLLVSYCAKIEKPKNFGNGTFSGVKVEVKKGLGYKVTWQKADFGSQKVDLSYNFYLREIEAPAPSSLQLASVVTPVSLTIASPIGSDYLIATLPGSTLAFNLTKQYLTAGKSYSLAVTAVASNNTTMIGDEKAYVLAKVTTDDIGSSADSPTNPGSGAAQPIVLLVQSGDNQNANKNSIFGIPAKVKLIDANNAPISNALITFAPASGSALTVSQGSVTTDSAGFAETIVSSTSATGTMSLIATYLAGSSTKTATFSSLNVVPPSSIAKISGDLQIAAPGATLANPLKILVNDAGGNPLAGVLIKFSSPQALFTGSVQVQVATDSSGFAAVTPNLSTITGVNTITAALAVDATKFVAFTATSAVTNTALADPLYSFVSSSLPALTADGVSTSTITLRTKDQFGNNLINGGRTIVFTSSPAGLMVGGTFIDVGNGTYTQSVRAPATNASVNISITASVNGVNLTSSPALIGLNASTADLTLSTVTAATPSIAADGLSQSLITVTLKDGLGNALTASQTTALLAATVLYSSAGTLVGSLAQNPNGSFSQYIRSGVIATTAILSATLSGSAITNTGSVIFTPGVVDPTKSRITASPSTLAPDGVSVSTITVLAKDQYYNLLNSSAGAAVLNTTNGTWVGAIVDNNNGTYQRTLRAPFSAGAAIISGTINGSAMPSINVYFNYGGAGPSAANSTIQICDAGGLNCGSNFYLAAGSGTTGTVKVILRDTTNTQMAGGGSVVTIATTAGTLIAAVADNNNGTYTQVITAAAVSSTGTITATFDGVSITSASARLFNYGSFSTTNSTVTAIPTLLKADGVSTGQIVITAKDSSGIAIPVGGVAGLTITTTGGTMQGAISDNANGSYTQNILASGAAVVATVSGRLSGTVFATASLNFYTPSVVNVATIDCTNIATWNNRDIVIDGGTATPTVTMNSLGINGTCPASFTFSSISVINGGKITHGATTSSQEYGLTLTSNAVTIDASSSIDVSGKGYQSQVTGSSQSQGNIQVVNKLGGGSSGTGGSYGGEGAKNTPFPTYGSLFYPVDLGSSGTCDSAVCASWNKGSAGGGLLQLIVSGSLSLAGSILANGETNVYANGGCCAGGSGSGGSIWINALSIAGTGVISANGADSTQYINGSVVDGGAGGGGRVAIYFTNNSGNFAAGNVTSNVKAAGGRSANVANIGAAGTVFLLKSSQTYGDLIVNNNGYSSTVAKTIINVPAAALPNSITSTTITLTNAFSEFVASRSPFAGYYVIPDINQNALNNWSSKSNFLITAASQSSITSSGGGLVPTGSTSKSLQLVIKLDHLHVVGKAYMSGNAPIIVSSGDLSAGNTAGNLVNATGIPSNNVEYVGIANLTIDQTGLSSVWTPTIYNYGAANVTLKNSTFNFTGSTPFVAGNLVLDGGTVTCTYLKGNSCLNLSGTLTLQTNATLQQATTTTTNEYSLEITSAGLNIAAGSSISAVGRGYVYTTPYYFRSFGNVDTYGMLGYAAGARSSGSHGGIGGAQTQGIQINSYGSISNPYESGSSSDSPGDVNSSGGGIIRLNLAAGTATVNGTIDASGASVGAGSGYCGTGAGGSVLIKTGSVTGSGSIAANGGTCTSTSGLVSGGGGGRIAAFYTSGAGGFATPASMVTRFSAAGGVGTASSVASPAYTGGAGTIYLKKTTQTYGDLIVNSSVATTNATFINFPTSSTSTSISTNTLTKSGAFSELTTNTNYLLGYSIDANTSQNGTPIIADDTFYPIISQTTDSVTVAPANDLTAAPVNATSGSPFTVVLALDHLDVMNGAQITSNGKIYVGQGDVNTALANSLTANGSITSTTTFPEFGPSILNFTFRNGAYTLPNGLSGTSLTLDNVTTTIGCVKGTVCLNFSGNLNVINGSVITQIATNSTTEYSIEAQAGAIVLDSSSKITGSAKGYLALSPGVQVFGNILNGTVSRASHGGRTDNANAPYGSLTDPYSSGTGTPNAPGGGIIRLKSLGTFQLSGTIDANGTTPNPTYQYASAGGSINIESVGALSGAGSISANGGIGAAYTSGASGGRIAVKYGSSSGGFAYPSAILARVSATGTNGANATTPGPPGTIYLKNLTTQTYGDLVINNANYANTATSAAFINIPAVSASTALTSTVLSGSGFLEAGLLTNHLVGFYLNPNTAQNATVTLTDDTLYKITGQTGTTLTTPGNMTAIGTSGNNYQAVLKLDHLEIAAGGRLETNGPILVLNGDVSSGTDNTFTPNGVIQYTAGSAGALELANLQNMTWNAGGGSVSTLPLTFAAAATTISLQNGTFNFDSLTLGAGQSLTLSNFANLVSGSSSFATPHVNVPGTLTVSSNSNIVSKATTASTENRLYIQAGNLTVDGTSSINANGKGYSQQTINYGRTYGNTDTSVSCPGRNPGGNYGGTGSDAGWGVIWSDTYGSFVSPTDLGSSGCSSGNSSNGGSGGGALRFAVPGTLTNNGVISVAGAGGGSGGSVLINSVGTLTGSGTISANGGSTYNYGGGGRVAIYYTTLAGGFLTSPYTTIQAYTASPGSGNGAAAGTIYLKSGAQSYGDLIVNNNGSYSTYQRTFIGSMLSASTFGGTTPSTGTAISSSTYAGGPNQTTINTSLTGTINENNLFKGMYINPKITQNGTTRVRDDSLFPIITSTLANLIVSGDSTAISTTGASTMKLVLVLDHLELRGSSYLDLGANNVYVLSGDLSSGVSTTLNLDGKLKANVLDTTAATTVTATANGSLPLITSLCSANASNCP